MVSLEPIVCPVRDCPIPIDVMLRSSENFLIGAHKANLSHHSDGFPDVDAVSDSSEVVDVTESTETLKLLMKFVHKRPYPNVSLLQDNVLLDLAMASEKYMVHSAMIACSMCLQFTAQKYPIRALAYAVQYGYAEIMDAAAPFTVFESMETVENGLNSESALFAWVGQKRRFEKGFGSN
ncbi:hypothetical protein FA13DRAFT_1867456 [Coprinellus micaceus]|uniref:BTB domain-containing protein n=1 Tax=Coprinellus micaceus TaxID=71717 RepID=A0A4Y7TU66_COPMI|nr:hypothetical protein FA13DRAFT_1867456 [Coprinellus micaceus]